MPDGSQTALSPEQAVDRLEAMHAEAVQAQRDALARFAAGGAPPDPEERRALPLSRTAPGLGAERADPGHPPRLGQVPGARRLRHHGHPARLLPPLSARAAAAAGRRNMAPRSRCALSDQEMPYPYVLDRGDELAHSGASPAELARHFPTPLLSAVGDEVADGLWTSEPGQPRPLALFDAVRVDYSLRRLLHYTGTDWRGIQPWILLTNYQRYIDQFVRWGLDELADPASPYDRLIAPGGVVASRGDDPAEAEARLAAAPWHRFQMPAYHLTRAGRAGRGDDRQHRRRPVERQEHHRPPGGAAAALLADGRPLRRLAAVAGDRRLRAGARLSAARPHPG